MKRLVFSLILAISVLVTASAIAGMPPPFDAAKRIATSGECREVGCVWKANDPSDKDIIYAIVLDKQLGAISLCLVDKANAIIIGITFADGKIIYEVVIVTPLGEALLEQKELAEKEGLELAFKFFRELVSKDLI